uniref:Uncharacterized protein n=1 Tax=Ascaris lumbricoides TaxID=6252 RepID=A0A0M3HN81_ASCLU
MEMMDKSEVQQFPREMRPRRTIFPKLAVKDTSAIISRISFCKSSMIRLPCLCVSQRRLSSSLKRHPALTALGVSFIRIIKVIDFADDVLSSTLLIRRNV